jgi:oligoendopeptidase F
MIIKVFNLSIILTFILMFKTTIILGQETKQIPDYSLTDRKDVPGEFTWKIEDIFKNDNEWALQKETIRSKISNIDNLKQDWTSAPTKMLVLLELLNEINILASKLSSYVSHQQAADLSDTKFQKMEGELQSIFVDYRTKLSFINPDILKLGETNFKKYIETEPKLATYNFMATDIFRNAAHILPEDQQKIVSLTGLFSGVPSKTAGILNDMELPPPVVTINSGEKVVLNYANYVKFRSSKIRNDRTLVMKEFWKDHKRYENTFATLQDGAVKNHFFDAKVRKFDNCLDARLFYDNIPREVYLNLIKYVKENTAPLHKYLKLKQRLLKLDKYMYEDIYASAVPSVEKVYTFKENEDIIIESLKPLGKDYTDAVKLAFEERWIDIYPNKNKESGAYSEGVYGIHPYIKLNYNGKYDAVSTTAHELGHAMHSFLTNKTQHYVNSGYTTFIAEIASTFNENLLMEYMLKNETDDLYKLYILDAYLDQVRGTLYRQTLFAEFELAMHEKVESGSSLTSDWLNKKYLELTREYYGHDKGVCEVDDYIQSEWSKIPHFYYNFYVFQYSTGIISSMALADMILKGGDKEKESYLTLLKSGGIDYSINLLKNAGVDMTVKEPYEMAFSRFSYLVDEMDKIINKLNN